MIDDEQQPFIRKLSFDTTPKSQPGALKFYLKAGGLYCLDSAGDELQIGDGEKVIISQAQLVDILLKLRPYDFR